MIDLNATEAGHVLMDYIRRLDPEAKDRILQAQEWAPGGSGEEGVGPKCLLQHVDWDGYWNGRTMVVHQNVYQAFDGLCSRFGVSEVIPALKAYAAKGRRLEEFESEVRSEAVRKSISAWWSERVKEALHAQA